MREAAQDPAGAGLPTFFVIGAMKSATTTLCDWLDAQVGVAMSDPKEPGIFNSDATVATWLPKIDSLYSRADAGDLRGDGSTDYSKLPLVQGVPERVHRRVPGAKIIYVVRNPIERAKSQYRFEWLLEGHSKSFVERLEEPHGLVEFGLYGYQITPWVNRFGADNVLLVFAERLVARPEDEMIRVLDFLGMEPVELRAPHELHRNDSSTLVRRSRMRGLLRDSAFGEVVRPLVPGRLVDTYKRRVAERSQPVVPPATERWLRERFDLDLVVLSRLTRGPALTCETWSDVVRAWTPDLHQEPEGPPPT